MTRYVSWVVFGVYLIPCEASLFLTQDEREQALQLQGPCASKWDHKPFPLHIEGIFRRPDLQQWTVWINGHRIDSQSPQSIEGWTITAVGFDTVTVCSTQGERVVLRLASSKNTESKTVTEGPQEATTPLSTEVVAEKETPATPMPELGSADAMIPPAEDASED